MTTGKFIRIALVGLPAGIFLIAGMAVVVTHLSPDWLFKSTEEFAEERKDAAEINRREINEADLKTYVRILSDTIGERHIGELGSLKKAAVWIESTLGLTNTGYPIRRQNFDHADDKIWNVIVELPGTSRENEIVVVGARYDSAEGSPGAHANASGVAAMVALARAYSGNPQARTIQFVGFANDETISGFAAASKVFGKKIHSMVYLNSLGVFSDEPGSQKYETLIDPVLPKTADFVAFAGYPESEELGERAQTAFFRASEIPTVFATGIESPELLAFSKGGLDAIQLTDTGALRNPDYRTPADTQDKLDFERLTSVVMGMKTVIEALANP